MFVSEAGAWMDVQGQDAGIGGIGKIISLDSNHSTANCAAQPRGFTN